jgi:hypothetical protein
MVYRKSTKSKPKEPAFGGIERILGRTGQYAGGFSLTSIAQYLWGKVYALIYSKVVAILSNP